MTEQTNEVTEEVTELPQGNIEAAPEEEVTQEEEEVADDNEGEVKIGNMTFKSQADAAAHLQKIENENIQLQSYNAGLLEGRSPAPYVPQAAAQEEDLLEGLDANEIYDKPADFLKKFASKIEAKVQKKNEAVMTQRQTEQKIWSDFTENYPELGHVVDYAKHRLMNNYWNELSPLKSEQAMAILATRIRQELRINAAGEKVLSTKGRASPGSQISVTTKKKEEPELDFATQINQNRAKRLKRS